MAASAPRVSIITPTYNYSSALRCAIQSVLNQTFREYEYLIIGDGCTDDSAEVVASFADARLLWHNLPENSGNQSIPNNKGIELARGEYIAYLGHDDLWHPTHLERLVQAMDDARADWGTALTVMIAPPESGGVKILNGLVEPGTDLRNAWFLPSGLMHTRALARQVGGWRDYRTIELNPDTDFGERARAAAARFAHVDNVSVFKFASGWRKNVYRRRPDQEQRAYLARMADEPDFIVRELLDAHRTLQYGLWDKWLATTDLPPVHIDPAAPRGARVESWRLYRGLESKPIAPRPLWQVAAIRTRRFIAQLTRPLRKPFKRLK
jgi:glycosyltransferase involved in cell wall biosynthesis